MIVTKCSCYLKVLGLRRKGVRMSVIFRIMPVFLESTAEGVWRCDCLQRIGECVPSNRGLHQVRLQIGL